MSRCVGVAWRAIKNQGNEMRLLMKSAKDMGPPLRLTLGFVLAILLSWKSLEANKTGKQ